MLGFIFSLLVGALAGYIAGRIMGSETSTLRNIVLGILGGFVGSILFGLIGLSATGIVGDPRVRCGCLRLHLDRPQAVQVIFHFMPWLLFEFFSKGSFILSNASFAPLQAQKSGLDSIPEV